LEKLGAIAQKYDKTIAQVALNWVKQQPGITAVISGLTLRRENIIKNVEALDWALDPDDVQWLSQQSDILFEQPGDVYSYERQ
jgi:aryl-alcohol dehydrogenase-like predicted oxidoreductase